MMRPCLVVFMCLILITSCSFDANCTLEGRPSVCLAFEDKNGSPVLPKHIAYTIQNPQHTEASSYQKHPELLSSIIRFESKRQISKRDLLAHEGKGILSITLGTTIDRRRVFLCIDNSMTGKYTLRLLWSESKGITQHVIQVRGGRCGPIREMRDIVLPFALCDEELRSQYADELQSFPSCPLR